MYLDDQINRTWTFQDVCTILRNCNPANGDQWAQMKREVRHWANQGIEEMMQEIERNHSELMRQAFPNDVEPLALDADYPQEKCEEIAKAIYELLLKNDMWIDTTIFYGSCNSLSTTNGMSHKYNGEPFTKADDPREFFEYVANPHIISMTFDSVVYEMFNYGDSPRVLQQFDKLLASYGLYYELGNAWNLTCYKKE